MERRVRTAAVAVVLAAMAIVFTLTIWSDGMGSTPKNPNPPSASIPLAAAKNGAPYVIINRGDTDHDRIATLRLEGDVAELLPPAVRALP